MAGIISQVSYFSYWGMGDARHVHLLIVAPYLSQTTWSDLWRLCTGYRVVFIRSVDDIEDLIKYIKEHPMETFDYVTS